MRTLLTPAVALAAALAFAGPVEAKRAILAYTPIQKLVRADAVVVGKVTAIEKELVDAAAYPDAKEKVAYKVAVIKVETNVAGAANTTHVKVGFVPAAPVDPTAPVRPGRGGFQPINLAEGQEGVFFLVKHHAADFYTISTPMAPTDAKAADYKAVVEQVTKGAAVIADPLKALKAEKAEDRAFAAFVMANKYRTPPEGGAEIENVKVSAEESKLILKGLAEANWKPDPNTPHAPNPYLAFSLLLVNDKDGWKFPMVKPGEDFIDKTKEAFAAWVAGAGKDYQINKMVPKKK